MSPSLDRAALRNRSPVGTSDAISLVTWAGCSRCVPCVEFMCPPVVVEGLLLACQWEGLIGCEDWLWLQWSSCCAQADRTQQICFSRDLVSAKSVHSVPCLWRWLGGGLLWLEAALGLLVQGHLVWATRWSAEDCHFTRLGDAWERLSCMLRLAVTSVGLGVA